MHTVRVGIHNHVQMRVRIYAGVLIIITTVLLVGY